MTTKDVNYWLTEKELKTPKHDEMVLFCFNNPLRVLAKEVKKQLKDELRWNVDCCKNPLFRYFSLQGEKITFNVEKLEEAIISQKKRIGETTDSIKRELEDKEKTKDSYWITGINQRIANKTEELDNLKQRLEEMKSLWEDQSPLINKYLEELNALKSFCQKRNMLDSSCFEIDKKIEFSLGNGKWNIGFIDLRIFVKPKLFQGNILDEVTCLDDTYYYLEIKPEVKSMGEVMRQLNFYRDYIPRERRIVLVLVTETEGLNEIFESQGIFVYNYGRESQPKLF